MGVNIRYRILVSFSLWLSLLMFYVLRGNMSVAILAMNAQRINVTQKADCSGEIEIFPKIKENGPFNWNALDIGTVLSAFFYGYMVAHILGAICSTMIGPRVTLTVCIAGATLFNFLVVPMSYLGYEACVVARFFVGFFSGPALPIIHQMVGRWAPLEERTVYGVITHTGNIFGLIVNFSVGAYMNNIDVDGWKYFLYFSGALGIFSLIIWLIFAYDQPWKHPFISKSESDYIISSLYPNGIPDEKNAIKKVPFKDLFLSKNVYLLAIAHFSYCFLLYLFLTGFAKYLSDVFGLDVETASYYSIIPFVMNFLFQLIVSFIANTVISKKIRSVTFVRKVVTFTAILGACPLMIPIGYLNCNQMNVCIALLSICCGFVGLFPCGFFVGMIDIAPQYAGYVMAIDNTFGSAAGIINPQLGGFFIQNYGNKEGWKYLFLITAIVSFICSGIWIIWGTCERRAWAGGNMKYEIKNESRDSISIDQE